MKITDKVDQLRYNLCENYPTCQSIILIPQFGGYKMHKIGIKIILYSFCNIPIRNPLFLPSKNSKCSPEELCILLICKGVYFLFLMICHI